MEEPPFWEVRTEGTLRGRDRWDPAFWAALSLLVHPPWGQSHTRPVASGPGTSGLEGQGLPWGFPGGTHGKEPPANTGDVRDTGVILRSERFPEEGNSYAL